MSSPLPPATPPELTLRRLRLLILVLATTSGLSVANIFYSQPLLDLIADTFHTTEGSAAIVVTVTQLGYAAGIIVLMPLGDLLSSAASSSAEPSDPDSRECSTAVPAGRASATWASLCR